MNVHLVHSALAGFGLSACDAHDISGKQELEKASKITEDWKAITVHVPLSHVPLNQWDFVLRFTFQQLIPMGRTRIGSFK